MSKKVDKAKLDEFYQEVQDFSEGANKNDLSNSGQKSESNHFEESKPYQCPKCHKLLSSRKEPCKYCHYDGYIPMGDAEIKKTRAVLFIIILIAAVVIYILTR